MASQKFTKVTLFFNCKLLYGGENKIFAYKHEMITKLSQISDARKEINFINGRTVPFSKEFSMHFKWEEFPTYRDKPFNYPNYAVFSDGTVSRTFGYFVTSSNTKNLPSDTVELFFKYDSFINNTIIIKQLKNKPIERITLDGFKSENDYLIYNDTQTLDFKPNVLPFSFKSPYENCYKDTITVKSSTGTITTLTKAENCYCLFLKYTLDPTAALTTDNVDISFSDEYPLFTVYVPFCIVSNSGEIINDFLTATVIEKNNDDTTCDYTTDNDNYYKLWYQTYRLGNYTIIEPFKAMKYLESKAVAKRFTFEACEQVLYKSSSDIFIPVDKISHIKVINDINCDNLCFFSRRTDTKTIDIKNYYSLTKTDINRIISNNNLIEKIIYSIGSLNIYPYNYFAIKLQNNETNLIPLRNFGEKENPGHSIKSYGDRNNTFIFSYKVSENFPKILKLKCGSQVPITKSALDMYIMNSSNQIQNEIKYAQMQKNLNDGRILANGFVGATGVIGNIASGNIAGAITSAGNTATNTYFGFENEKLKVSKLIDTNKAIIDDLKNTNGTVDYGEDGAFDRVIEENFPSLINYKCANNYELEIIALFVNKYGITYNAVIENVFKQNHENFDYYKFLEFDEQELDIQPNDERKEVYNILISGVRIWHNLEKIGSENSYNQPLSFTKFIGGN